MMILFSAILSLLHFAIHRLQLLHNFPEQLYSHQSFQTRCKILPGQDKASGASPSYHKLPAWDTIAWPGSSARHARLLKNYKEALHEMGL